MFYPKTLKLFWVKGKFRFVYGDWVKGWERREISIEGKGNYPKELWAEMGKGRLMVSQKVKRFRIWSNPIKAK